MPCWVTSTSGPNARSTPGTTAWKARNHDASPVPDGSAIFTAVPSAPPCPHSDGNPVKGNDANGVSWMDTVNTRGSS